MIQLNEAPINKALATVGYQRQRSLVYKAQWSTPDVEHFISFSRHGTAKASLSADFGLRNPDAEIFSAKCLYSYGGDLYNLTKPNTIVDYRMRFSFGRLGSKVQRWELYLPDLSSSELSQILKDYIRERLLPVVRNIITLDRLLDVLTRDSEPCPWISTNGLIRTAQIVSVGRQIGLSGEHIRAILEPHERYVQRDLREISGKKVGVGSFIDSIIADWEAES
jgi:hypothetical protein